MTSVGGSVLTVASVTAAVGLDVGVVVTTSSSQLGIMHASVFLQSHSPSKHSQQENHKSCHSNFLFPLHMM